MQEEVTFREILLLSGLLVSPLVVIGFVLLFRRTLKSAISAPLWFVAFVFILGATSVYAVLFISSWGAKPSNELSLLLQRISPDPLNLLLLSPLSEECCKGIILLPLLLTRKLRNMREGLFYGAVVGFGFAVMENHRFFMRATSLNLLQQLLLTRTLFASLGHALTSSLWGASLGWVKEHHHRRTVHFFIPVGVFVFAVFWHSAWNAMVLWGNPGDGSYPLFCGLQLVAAGAVVWGSRRNNKQTANEPV